MTVSSSNPTIKHVAVIMDGNGRWAQSKNHMRVWGHVRGANRVSAIVEEATTLGLESLTLYTFSTENWSRPVSEIKVLFKLLKKFLLKEREKIIKNRIRFRAIGDSTHLPIEVRDLVSEMESTTKDNSGMKLNLALSYGSRHEILSAVNRWIKDHPGCEMEEGDLAHGLLDPDVPEIDLLIRTGGDQRVSNFLLWQIAYAELCFTPTMWPDFKVEEFKSILTEVGGRERRFGNVECGERLENSQVKARENLNHFRQTESGGL